MSQTEALWRDRTRRCAGIFAIAAAACGAPPQASAAAAPDDASVICLGSACSAVASGAYPGLVVGSVERVLTPAESAEFFGRARATGAWRALPEDPLDFARLVRGVVLRTRASSGGSEAALSFIALMTEDEYRDTGIAAGAFVRYAPHGPDHDAPPADQPELLPYWNVTGCVMALCRQGDKTCEARYLPGIYERHTGVLLDWRSARPAAASPSINPRTQLPLQPATGARAPVS